MVGTTDGLGFGLLVAALWFGFRHGIDFDHIAAITDITSSVEERRRALLLGTLYAVGHGLVVLLLGVVAILLGERLPAGVDEFMGRIVGVTLLLLGVYVIVSLIRHGRDFRLRSRWMLVFAGVRRGTRWVREKVRVASPEAVPAGVPAGAWSPKPAGNGAAPPDRVHHGHHGRPGHHHHVDPGHDEAFMSYGRATAFGVGMIHGVGAETPTQVLIFLAAAGAGGGTVGIAVLVAFILGLLASNSLVTVGAALGFMQASRNFAVYAGVAVLTAAFSLFLGTVFLLDVPHILPPLLGG